MQQDAAGLALPVAFPSLTGMDAAVALLLAQDGITNGAIYALLALALVLVFAVTRVIFIPQGEFVAYGALTYAMLQGGHVPGTAYLLPIFGFVALLFDLFEIVFQTIDLTAYNAPVDLDLAFARAAQEAEAAALAFQVGPGPHQPAALVFQRGELDLQAAFMSAGARTEYLEDQSGAIDDFGPPGLFKIALLDRREPVVDDHESDPLLFHGLLDAFDDAFADQGGRRDTAQRDTLRESDIEIDCTGETDRFLELCLGAALATARPCLDGAEHGRGHRRPHGLPRAAPRFVRAFALVLFGQISLLLRPCRRRTTAPA